MIAIYPDTDQQDAGYHYLFARWAWRHPEYFVSVWARPLFTFLYSFPAQWGYTAARLFTLLLALAAARQTYQLARRLDLAAPELAIPLLFLQPTFWLLSTGVFTETLFALLLALALRLHLEGSRRAAILAAASLILVRPEGFFIGILWGAWLLGEHFSRPGRGLVPLLRQLWQTLWLASGMVCWWTAAYVITGDPLWIVHNWPPDWQAAGQANGTGPIWWYLAQLPLMVGPFFLLAFFRGGNRLARERKFLLGYASFVTLFSLHSVMYAGGWFGAAGYARYFVCVSPAIAIIVLAGRRISDSHLKPAMMMIMIPALLLCVGYSDILTHGRDAAAIEEMHDWYERTPAAQSLPVTRLVCSQSYMRIVFDRDHWEMPGFSGDRQRNLETIRQLAAGTLVFWDRDTGPKWYLLTAEDFQAAGFELLRAREYRLEGYFIRLPREGTGGTRSQSLYLLYKRGN